MGGVTGQAWLAAERLGERARDAHRFLEWDGWEEGLLDGVIASLSPPISESASLSSERTLATPDEVQPAANIDSATGKKLVGGTFKMKNGFIGLSLT